MLAVFNVKAAPSHTGLLLVIVGVGGNAFIINDTESCYLCLFLHDLSDALDDSSKLI